MFERMREDIQSVFHRDPAARSAFEVGDLLLPDCTRSGCIAWRMPCGAMAGSGWRGWCRTLVVG